MTRLHKITIGIFCGGILLTGIGAGVAFGEFSGLNYGGTEIVGTFDRVTKEISKEIDPDLGTWSLYGFWDTETELVTDKSIPENTVTFRITYNAEQVDPDVIAETETEYYDEDTDEYTTEIDPSLELRVYWKGNSNEIKDMMEAKDKVLAGLKQGKLISVEGSPGIEKVEIRVNPVNEKDVRIS